MIFLISKNKNHSKCKRPRDIGLAWEELPSCLAQTSARLLRSHWILGCLVCGLSLQPPLASLDQSHHYTPDLLGMSRLLIPQWLRNRYLPSWLLSEPGCKSSFLLENPCRQAHPKIAQVRSRKKQETVYVCFCEYGNWWIWNCGEDLDLS